jgi:hypothetical protein
MDMALTRSLVILLCCCSTVSYSQVKIGNNPNTINPNAMLEIESTDKGLLLPRLALKSTTNPLPLVNFVEGMFVFNTANQNDITPGIYYSDGTKWIRVNGSLGGSSGSAGNWSLDGNSGTDPSKNYIGTGDKKALVLKTNNEERMRVTEDGKIGIGTANPKAALHVNGQLVIDTMLTGDLTTDYMLVANPSDGRVKMLPIQGLTGGTVLQRVEMVKVNGQTVFNTPMQISDISRILVYRNGVLISSTKNGNNSIITELACMAGDEIKIIQLN